MNKNVSKMIKIKSNRREKLMSSEQNRKQISKKFNQLIKSKTEPK